MGAQSPQLGCSIVFLTYEENETLIKRSQDKCTEVVHLVHCLSYEERETPLGLLSNPMEGCVGAKTKFPSDGP